MLRLQKICVSDYICSFLLFSHGCRISKTVQVLHAFSELTPFIFVYCWYSSVQLDYRRIGRRRWRWNHSRDSFFFKSLVWVWVGRVWMCLVKLCISAQFFLTHQLVARMIYYCELVGIEDGAVVHRCSAALTTPAKFDDKYSCVSHLDDWVQWAHIVQCHCSIWFRQMVIRYLHC